MNRRGFLRLCGGGAATALVAALAPREILTPPMRLPEALPTKALRSVEVIPYYDGEIVRWRGIVVGIRGPAVLWGNPGDPAVSLDNWWMPWLGGMPQRPVSLRHDGDDLLCVTQHSQVWRLRRHVEGDVLPFSAYLEVA